MNNNWPSKEQIEALHQWKREFGRNWKDALRRAWFDGDYMGFTGESAYLQQVRNTFGPSWLIRLRLLDNGGWSVKQG